MKKIIKIAVVFLVLTCFAFLPPAHHIEGHWRISYSNGQKDFLDLKKDGTFRNFNADGQTLRNGNFKYSGDVFSINDKGGCGDTYWATYKFTFHGEDSISFAVIEDSCTGRRQQIEAGGLKRMK
jgi:hypothetical protein